MNSAGKSAPTGSGCRTPGFSARAGRAGTRSDSERLGSCLGAAKRLKDHTDDASGNGAGDDDVDGYEHGAS